MRKYIVKPSNSINLTSQIPQAIKGWHGKEAQLLGLPGAEHRQEFQTTGKDCPHLMKVGLSDAFFHTVLFIYRC